MLAHSLAAVSVNLQAAEDLLGELDDDSPELAKAVECVARAGAFTREGMAEARRAVTTLRDNASPPPPAPLADQLAALAAEYRADGDAAVEFGVTGAPRPLAAGPALAAYRTVQEALTNARKHAPASWLRSTSGTRRRRYPCRSATCCRRMGRPGRWQSPPSTRTWC